MFKSEFKMQIQSLAWLTTHMAMKSSIICTDLSEHWHLSLNERNWHYHIMISTTLSQNKMPSWWSIAICKAQLNIANQESLEVTIVTLESSDLAERFSVLILASLYLHFNCFLTDLNFTDREYIIIVKELRIITGLMHPYRMISSSI
jgi:hypothetical protein